MLWPTYTGFVADINKCCGWHRSHCCGRRRQVLWPTQVTALADVNRYFYCCGRRRSEFLLLWPAQARIFTEAGQCSGWHRQLFLFTQASIFTDTGLCCGRRRHVFFLTHASVVTCVLDGAGQYFCGRKWEVLWPMQVTALADVNKCFGRRK